MRRVFILAGGNSLKGFDFASLKGEEVIAVNKAIFSAPFAKYFVTMDFSFFQKVGEVGKAGVLRSPATKVFVANFSVPYLKEQNGQIVDTRFPLVYKLDLFDVILKSRKRDGMGLSLKDFRNGSNSGFCGLQLAVALGYTQIFLLGFDLVAGKKETHYHGGYGEPASQFSKKLPEYLDCFVKGLEELKRLDPQVRVVSCSPISRLNQYIPFVNVDELVGGG